MTGTSDELLLRKMAPKATRVEFKLIADVALAVSSGRADAFTTTVLASMVMKQKNPALGDFMNPKPRVALPGYIGLRLEDDQRWQKFLDRWSEWNILLGHNERRMREALAKDGLEVPSTVSFSPN
jgi:polar amino acid transport system substrate-binding protein